MNKERFSKPSLTNFKLIPVEFEGIKPINPLFSECSIKILYTGENRNGVIIDQQTVEEMIKTMHNIPIVGEYAVAKQDFKGHGEEIKINDEGIEFIVNTKPYGVIPESSKISWVEVEEPNGIINKYLTATGYLWTARYPELQRVIEKGNGQSMELDPSTLEGYWEYKNGREWFHITKAYFSALCILGEDVEPAFESASIGSVVYTKKEDFLSELSEMMFELSNSGIEIGKKEKGRGEEMDEVLNNTEIKEEVIEEIEIVEENAEEVVDEFVENKEEIAEDVVEEEVVEENVEEEVVVDYAAVIEDLNNEIATLKATIEGMADYQELKDFKLNIDKEAKMKVLKSFKKLGEEIIKPFEENLEKYSVEDLEKELLVVAYRKGLIFSEERESDDIVVPENNLSNEVKEGWEKLIQKSSKRK